MDVWDATSSKSMDMVNLSLEKLVGLEFVIFFIEKLIKFLGKKAFWKKKKYLRQFNCKMTKKAF